ncbi:MAG: lysophospholipid acyltransferase family protein [Pseudomonadota bacterium]|nr:lysophospholipid acyltransferase family protein [Pseudomonadota bacterium]
MSLRRFTKSLLQTGFFRGVASWLIVFYVWLVERTSRFDLIGREHWDPLNVDGKGVIIAFWHSRLLMTAILRRETAKRVFMLSSMHRDAEIVVNAAKRFGVEFIRGSAANPKKAGKDKKGGPALVQMIGALREGHVVGVNPDGPRGPREVAHIGVIRLAQFSGAPILPGAYSMTRGRFLGTWDRFFLPLPFSRGCFIALAPISVPADASPELMQEKRLELERALNEATRLADARAGQSPDSQTIG